MEIPLRLSPKLVTVDRGAFQMNVWRMNGSRYELRLTFPIAVGQIGHETPTGMYFIQAKTRTPDWLAPDSDWVPEEHRNMIAPFWLPDYAAMGLVDMPSGFIPRDVKNVPLIVDGDPVPNPENPFKVAFISIGDTDGVGFHGTKFNPLLGQEVSHGCIRMATWDIRKFYDRAPIGTPVFIHG